MGGRGSGGSRGGGGASKSINAKAENELNYLLNKSYKYDDDAYEFSRRAASEQAIARKYKQAGKKELAEKYTQYAKEAQAKADEAKAQSKKFKTEASKLASENGARTVYKSPQNARKAYDQARENLVSTAYRDHPSIVKSPKGGYSVVPHGIAKLNNLKEISPYSIDMSES